MNKRKMEHLIRQIAEIISNHTAGTYTGGVEGVREAAENIVEFLKEEKLLDGRNRSL